MDLATELAHFTGTEDYYRHGLARNVVFTDGVRFFADKAGAHWLLDIIATELVKPLKAEGFLHIKAVVADGKAGLTADDGNGKVVWSRQIDFTDCPDGEWRFFFAPGGPNGTFVIMLPSEY